MTNFYFCNDNNTFKKKYQNYKIIKFTKKINNEDFKNYTFADYKKEPNSKGKDFKFILEDMLDEDIKKIQNYMSNFKDYSSLNISQ